MHACVLGSCQECSNRAANCVSPQHCRLGYPSQLLCLLVAWHPIGGQQVWSGSMESVEGARSRPLKPPLQSWQFWEPIFLVPSLWTGPCPGRPLRGIPWWFPSWVKVVIYNYCNHATYVFSDSRSIVKGGSVWGDPQSPGKESHQHGEAGWAAGWVLIPKKDRRLGWILDSRGLKFLFKLCVCVFTLADVAGCVTWCLQWTYMGGIYNLVFRSA